MGKTKLIYDVVKVLREKDIFRGTIKAEGTKGTNRIFNTSNEFEKNINTGQIKLKSWAEMEHDGQVVKHESTTEFNMSGCRNRRLHGFASNRHHCHEENHHERFGIKEKLALMAFMLETFNNLKIEKQGEQGVLLTLKVDELPLEIKEKIKEKIAHRHSRKRDEGNQDGFKGCPFSKEIFNSENKSFILRIWINQQNEVEKAVLESRFGKLEEEPEISFKVELDLKW